MKNIAQTGRRELDTHRRWISGVTASLPRYEDVDLDGNKEWVVDVYIGPLEMVSEGIVYSCLIASYAAELVGDLKQPVMLERSKQGKYTVVARTKNLAAGVVFEEDEEVAEPTYELTRYNLSSLGLRWIPDLDWVLEPLQADPDDELQADPDEPLQEVRAFDAFGLQVVGPEATEPEDFPDGSLPPAPGGGSGYSPAPGKGSLYDPTPIVSTTKKHLAVFPAKFGPYGDPDAMAWGDEDSVLQPMISKVVTE
jgi:hypothetical protein